MGERLLDHQQVIGVERPEEIRVRESVGRVGVDREHDPRVPPADLADDRDVGARLDLELDAAVAETEIAVHALVQGVHAGLDAQAHSDLDLVAHSSDDTGDGLAAQPRDEVHERELDSRLGHGVAAERAEARRQVVQVVDLLAEDRGAQVVADDVARGADRLVAEEGNLPGHALAPSRMAAGIEPDQEDEPRRHASEAHLEGLEQGEAHEAHLERVQAHGGGRPDRNNRCVGSSAHAGDTIPHPRPVRRGGRRTEAQQMVRRCEERRAGRRSCRMDAGAAGLPAAGAAYRRCLLKCATVRSQASLAAAASKRGVVSLLKPCCVPG